MFVRPTRFFFFFFNDTATTEIYTLSLHDALPICIFRSKTRDEWCAIMEGTDICFAPVLTMKEASQHPHAKARGAYVDVSGFAQPAPAPHFSRTDRKSTRLNSSHT